LIGGLFHMLALLAAAPLITIAALHRNALREKTGAHWSEWRRPLGALAIPFLALGAFFIWTFLRPAIEYDYTHPGLKQMASVVYELVGLSGFGPNRKFSLDFQPYLLTLAPGGLAVLSGLVCALISWTQRWTQREKDPLLSALAAAAYIACVEAAVLAVVTGKQPDARHLAALVPVFLFLFMGVASLPGRAASLSLVLLGGAWLASDIRLAVRPEYRKEDYRHAIAALVSIHRQTDAQIALATDAAAPAYYGLDVQGDAPCKPFGRQSCQAALDNVSWSRGITAQDVLFWPPERFTSWLESFTARGVPVAVLVQLDRAHDKPAWWPILAANPSATHSRIHGFELILLRPTPN
jgi:hypothetical protein